MLRSVAPVVRQAFDLRRDLLDLIETPVGHRRDEVDHGVPIDPRPGTVQDEENRRDRAWT